MKRYYVYDFVIGEPVLIDREQNTLTFYHNNIYGQLYDLEKGGEVFEVTKSVQNGLIRRLNGRSYSFSNAKAVDQFIYHLLFTEEQKAKCIRSAHNLNEKELIASSDELTEVIKAMCEFVYEKKYAWDEESKKKEKTKLMSYCKEYIKKLREGDQMNLALDI